MNSWALLGCATIGFACVFLLTPVVIRWRAAHARAAVSFHHTHTAPVSRFGGVALAAAFALVALFAFLWFPVDGERLRVRFVVVVSSLAMFGLGFLDDCRPLGAKRKLLGQVVISLGVCLAGVQIAQFKNPLTAHVYQLGVWGIPVTIAWLVAHGHRRVRYRGVERNQHGLTTRVAALNLRRLVNLGLDRHGGRWVLA